MQEPATGLTANNDKLTLRLLSTRSILKTLTTKTLARASLSILATGLIVNNDKLTY